jgi:hypothetical protein
MEESSLPFSKLPRVETHNWKQTVRKQDKSVILVLIHVIIQNNMLLKLGTMENILLNRINLNSYL